MDFLTLWGEFQFEKICKLTLTRPCQTRKLYISQNSSLTQSSPLTVTHNFDPAPRFTVSQIYSCNVLDMWTLSSSENNSMQ